MNPSKRLFGFGKIGLIFTRLGVSTQIMLIVGLGVLGLLALGGYSYLAAERQNTAVVEQTRLAELLAAGESLDKQMLQARRYEKDFLLRSDEMYVARHVKTMEGIRRNLSVLQAGVAPALRDPVQELSGMLGDYEKQFAEVVRVSKAIGLDEKSGLEGELRGAVNNVEKSLKPLGLDNLMVTMLMMRRHEKDFIMREQDRYIGRMGDRAKEFAAALDNVAIPASQKAEIAKNMDAYQAAFKKFAETTLALNGEIGKMSDLYAKADPVANSIIESVNNESVAGSAALADTARTTKSVTAITVAAITLVVLVLGLLAGRMIAGPIRASSKAAARLAEGNTDVEIVGADRRDELGQLARAMAQLRDTVQEAFRAKQVIEQLPVGVVSCDAELRVNFANKTSVTTIESLDGKLPLDADNLVGSDVAAFYGNKQSHLGKLSDPQSLPYHAVIEHDGEYLDVNASALFDTNGAYVGPCLSWSVVTEKVEADRETRRLLTMVDQMPVNVMTLDPQNNRINYLNRTCREGLKTIESHLPCKAEEVLGKGIEIFNANAASGRGVSVAKADLPFEGNVRLGEETLKFNVAAINDEQGNYIGPMVS